VDAFLTADLRHHPVSEARAQNPQNPLALLDAAHWATEWPWCELAAAQLDEISDREGWDLRVHVSKTVTETQWEPPTERRARRPDPTSRRPGPRRTPVAARAQAQLPARARRDRLADQGPHAAARPARGRADRGERLRP
jgi:hypothetical protein